jgi:hypothetical protein
MFQFCRFFFEFNNSVLKSGTINYIGSSQVEVGQTFFDVTNQKFGYVTAVAKQAQVGGIYTASASLSMVRNAMPTYSSKPVNINMIPAPAVYALPTLESVVNAFSGVSPISTDATPLMSSTGNIVNRNIGVQKLSALSKTNTTIPISGTNLTSLTGNTSN